MASFPHEYNVSAAGGPEGNVPVESKGLPTLDTAPPPEFGGPDGYWSPETMLTGAVANCLILTFRALAQARKLEWTRLEVDCTGQVDKTREGLRFTRFDLKALLIVTGSTDEGQARQILDNAKKHCLVTASLAAETQMTADVRRA